MQNEPIASIDYMNAKDLEWFNSDVRCDIGVKLLMTAVNAKWHSFYHGDSPLTELSPDGNIMGPSDDVISNLSWLPSKILDFHNKISNDSFISLFAFDPVVAIDSVITDTLINDTIKKEEIPTGRLEIVSSTSSSCIIQLLQNDKLIQEAFFAKPPYIIENISPAKYHLKYIYDNNQDSSWTTGSWERKTQAEKVINYPSEITIRSNWDLELEWLIEE